MSTDYSKLKNAELEALLKQRALPHTGKKAEMVARLQEDDASKPKAADASSATIDKEDEIDWDDDDDITLATTAPAAAAVAAGGQGQVANPTAVPNQVTADDPSKTSDLSVQKSVDVTGTAGTADTKAETKPPVDFSVGLASLTMDAELEKRKRRAERFGTAAPTADGADADGAKSEQIKQAELLAKRAAKFGTGSEAPRGLNEALPDKPAKRGREGGDEGRRGNHKRRGGGGGGEGGRRGNGPGAAGKPSARPGQGQGQQSKNGGWMSSSDRAAAEARKAKWATPSA